MCVLEWRVGHHTPLTQLHVDAVAKLGLTIVARLEAVQSLDSLVGLQVVKTG